MHHRGLEKVNRNQDTAAAAAAPDADGGPGTDRRLVLLSSTLD